MAFGGGVFVTQNKTMPGTYINCVNASRATANLGERGVVAIAHVLNKNAKSVIEITREEFLKDSNEKLGFAYTSDSAKVFREIFRHATKCVIYDLGEDGTSEEAIAALEQYDFNVLAAYTSTTADISAYITAVKNWRENGKKCQCVVYNPSTAPDSEGVINVGSTVKDSGAAAHALVAWVAGAEAGCAINKSCTNMNYDGEYDVKCTETMDELKTALEAGKLMFHLAYGEVRVLEDINSLTTTTTEKGEDFKYNQTIRVIDQIATDIAKIFNNKYLGKIPNNDSGRASLWADIIEHHKQLNDIQAIEGFNAEMVTVEQGSTKKSVVITDAIKVVNAMAILYMTVEIQ